MTRFEVVSDRSAITIEARSSVGPILWRADGVIGHIEAEITDGLVDPARHPTAKLALEVERLSSGNALYDAELRRRIDARRFPSTTVELREVAVLGGESRYQLQGDVVFHGVTRTVRGTVTAELDDDGNMRIHGDQVFDIRDFKIPSPTILMLKIFPDVRVRLEIEAQPEG